MSDIAIMGRQTLFNVAENIEQPKGPSKEVDVHARSRTERYPVEFHGSPYLTSPIRPIPPTMSRTREVTKKAKKRSTAEPKSKTRSPTSSSTFGHNRVASPYSESLYSLQSLRYFANGVSASNSKVSRQQQCYLILPSEIDELATFFGTNLASMDDRKGKDSSREHERQDHKEEYESTDSEDDVTLNTDFAASLNDDAILKHVTTTYNIINNNNDSGMSNKGVDSEITNSESDDESQTSDAISNTSQQLKLPSLIKEKQSKVSKRKSKKHETSISPYAISLNA